MTLEERRRKKHEEYKRYYKRHHEEILARARMRVRRRQLTEAQLAFTRGETVTFQTPNMRRPYEAVVVGFGNRLNPKCLRLLRVGRKNKGGNRRPGSKIETVYIDFVKKGGAV